MSLWLLTAYGGLKMQLKPCDLPVKSKNYTLFGAQVCSCFSMVKSTILQKSLCEIQNSNSRAASTF